MMRLAGIVVDECPKYLAQRPSLNNHTLYFEIDDIRIPLSLRGIISYLPPQVPTNEQLGTLPTLELTPQSNDWNPYDRIFQDQEDTMTNYLGELRDNPPPRQIFSVEQQMQPHIISSMIDRSLEVALFAEDLSRRRFFSNVDETTVLPITQL